MRVFGVHEVGGRQRGWLVPTAVVPVSDGAWDYASAILVLREYLATKGEIGELAVCSSLRDLADRRFFFEGIVWAAEGIGLTDIEVSKRFALKASSVCFLVGERT